MSKQIATGVEALAASFNREISDQWRSMRNRLDSLLLTTKILKTDEVQAACAKLDAMSLEERYDYIAKIWGPMYAEKAGPLLQQLQVLENAAN